MKNRGKVLIGVLICGLIAAIVVGCVSIADTPTPVAAMDADIQVREVSETPRPEDAVGAIYAELNEYSCEKLGSAELTDLVGIAPSQVEEAYAYYSNARSGLADVMIFKPYEDDRDKVREILYKYKDQRELEFENYDILNAYSIAQNAVIFDQGDYVILLMLEDNESAKAIIDDYIPQ